MVGIEKDHFDFETFIFIKVNLVFFVEIHSDDSLDSGELIEKDSLSDFRTVDWPEAPVI